MNTGKRRGGTGGMRAQVLRRRGGAAVNQWLEL